MGFKASRAAEKDRPTSLSCHLAAVDGRVAGPAGHFATKQTIDRYVNLMRPVFDSRGPSSSGKMSCGESLPVSINVCHSRLSAALGILKSIGSGVELKSIRMSRPTHRDPRPCRELSADRKALTPVRSSRRRCPLQSNQLTSGNCSDPLGCPVRYVRRRTVGCERRK